MSQIKVLFVCLGNICRSPLAQGLFKQLVEKEGLSKKYKIDSVATSHYEVGNCPDPRTIRNARENGLELNHTARQVTADDLSDSDIVLVMDKGNMDDVLFLMKRYQLDTRKVHYLREFDPSPGDLLVPDPYYGGPDSFTNAFELIKRSCEGLLKQLEKQ